MWIWFAAIVIVLVAVGIFLVRLRIAARKYYDKYRGAEMCTGEEVLYVSDPYLGSTLKPNARFTLRRRLTAETIYTDDRGERVAEPGQSSCPKPVLLAGDSFPLGTGVDYPDSLAARLQKEHGLDLGNVSVGTYSLLQALRRLEASLLFHRPRLAILVFNHGLVDRCFKTNAFLKGLGQRPVYAYKKSNKAWGLRENLWSPPVWVFQAIHLSRKRLIDPHPFGLADLFHYARIRLLMGLIVKVRAGVKLFRNARWKLVDESLYTDRNLRDKVLEDQLANLKAMVREYDLRVLFYQMFEYRAYQKRAEVIAEDMEFIRTKVADEPRIVVAGCGTEQALMDQAIADKGFPPGSYREALALPDDLHYTREGNTIQAKAIAMALRDAGWAELAGLKEEDR